MIPAFYAWVTAQSLYLLLLNGNTPYPSSIYTFLRYFDFVLMEFKFVPVLIQDLVSDQYIPKRGIFQEELENYGFYYNTISITTFRKILFWLCYFLVLLPVSLLTKRLFGEDSDNLYSWPDKFFFSGTMTLFFIQIQPFVMAGLAEVWLNQTTTDYEKASYSLACMILVMVSVGILNTTILILRHSKVSDHPLIQL